jgi:hypothetical protein
VVRTYICTYIAIAFRLRDSGAVGDLEAEVDQVVVHVRLSELPLLRAGRVLAVSSAAVLDLYVYKIA